MQCKFNFLKLIISSVFVSAPLISIAGPAEQANDRARQIVEFWTKERRDAAIPRDMVVDERGLGYMKTRNGELVPYAHNTPVVRGKPTACVDSSAPEISAMSPDATTVNAAVLFSANITDDCGLKSVSFEITYPNGIVQSFTPSPVGSDVWEIELSGFSDGDWSWRVIAKDAGPKGGNETISAYLSFTVDTSGDSGTGGGTDTGGGTGTGGEGSGGEIVVNNYWPASDEASYNTSVQAATGRIYFQMPTNKRKTRVAGYVCSGTVVNDNNSGRSVILTAAHCVYDDVTKSFAEGVLFIPNQNDTLAAGTDTNCSNDPMGCWVPSFGVVDENWTTRTFPDNIPWDYAFYVVNDSGAHLGADLTSDSLEGSAGALDVSFSQPSINQRSYALGYSYADDPDFMYCAEDMTEEGSANWWLASCGLSGGASGGPWIQPAVNEDGSLLMSPVISVNSWGYTTAPGMAGPILSGTSAEWLYDLANTAEFKADTDWQDGYIYK